MNYPNKGAARTAFIALCERGAGQRLKMLELETELDATKKAFDKIGKDSIDALNDFIDFDKGKTNEKSITTDAVPCPAPNGRCTCERD